MLHLYFSKMSGKKQKDILSFWAPKGKPPKKVARLEEETVEEVVHSNLSICSQCPTTQ